jgi:uncharacterized protein (TIGR02611 family)
MVRLIKRIAKVIAGMTVLLIGIIMIITPGPSTLVILGGLAILATEFSWARRSLQIIRKSAESIADKLNIRPFSRKIQAVLLYKISRDSQRSFLGSGK